MAYADLLRYNIDAATTSAADIMAAIAAHFDAAPGHYEVEYTGTENARVLRPKLPPTGYDHQISIRLDGSGNLRCAMDPGLGYTTGGSAAAVPSGGSVLESPERSTSISSGIGSTRIAIVEDLDSIRIFLFATSKTHMPKGLHAGHTWNPLLDNWRLDLGMQGFGVHLGAPNYATINSSVSDAFFGDGVTPGSAVLINGSWYAVGVVSSLISYVSQIPNPPSAAFSPVIPLPIIASNVSGAADLLCGMMIHFGHVAANDHAAQQPRATRNSGSPVDETWMYLNHVASVTQQVTSWEANATAP